MEKAKGYSYVFNFGKYKGRTVEYVMYGDPEYLVWANDHIPTFDLRSEIYKKAKERAEEFEIETMEDEYYGFDYYGY